MKINYRSPIKAAILLLYVMLTNIIPTAYAQKIPLNKYGLPVVNTVTLYKELVAADSNQVLVDITTYIPNIRKDVRYATTANFTHKILYPYAAVYLRLPAAKALKEVQLELNKKGLGLLIFDGYRPYSVTEMMWEIVPDDRYAADPHAGSGHNRGAAVDITIIDLHTGKPLPMPTGYDDFTEKAHHDYAAPDPAVTANRALLRDIMEQHGFAPLTTEWWHYYLKDHKRFPLMNIPFEELK